jgi:hypothetical protein
MATIVHVVKQNYFLEYGHELVACTLAHILALSVGM